jgi:hypothetical protein
VDGRAALRVSATRGTNAAQFVFRPSEVAGNKVTPDRSYLVRVEYHTEPGTEGYLHTQTRDDYAMIGRMVLRNQGAGWQTTTGTIKPNGKDFQIAIGCTRTVPGKFVSIGRVELIPEGAAPASDRLIYTLDLSRVQPFRFQQQDGQASDPDWRSKVPGGVYLHCWKKESVAEFRAEVTDSRASIGVANLNDNLSSQILFQFDGLNVPVQAGETYRVRMEYRTMNDAEGRVDVRNPKNGDYPSVAGARLEGTDGKWKAVELTFRRPADGNIDVCIINNALGEGNILSVRSLEVFEVGK